MTNRRKDCTRLLLLTFSLFAIKTLQAQLCAGSLGDPVVNITFGAGTNPGPQLHAATNYNYVGADCPNDGQYAIRNSSSFCFNNTFHTLNSDHTGNPNGYFMMVNASFQPGDFYLETVSGLCGNTTYEFAAWVMNVLRPSACGGNGSGIDPNLTFSIETSNGAVLAKYETGSIPEESSPVWKQYGMFFTTPASITSVVLRITNKAPGGCGNDLALDDITFRPCGAQIKAAIAGSNDPNVANVCEGVSAPVSLTAQVSAGYSAPAYQWQLSTDGGSTWKDLAGATATLYQHTNTARGTYHYRLTVAEAGNIGLSNCRIASNPVAVHVRSKPEIVFDAIQPACEGASLAINATVSLFSPSGWKPEWSLPSGNNRNISFAETPDTVNKTNVYSLNISHATLANKGVYTLTVTNGYGCTNSVATDLVLYEQPRAQFTSSSLACIISAIRFTDASDITTQTIAGWNWQFGNAGGSTEQSPLFSFAAAGTYPVQLVVRSNQGCTDTVTKEVVVHPLPQVKFGMPEVCLSDSFAAFSDSSRIADGSEGQFSYLWNFGDAAATPANPNTSNLKNPRHAYSATGHYLVRLTVTSGAGCVNDTVQTFTVNGATPRAAFALKNESLLCSADSAVLINNSTVNFGNITRLVIDWKGDNDPAAVTIDEEPQPGKTYSFRYDPFITGSSALFTLRMVAYSGSSCISESYRQIRVHKSPQVVFDAALGFCEEAPAYQITEARETTGLNGRETFSGNGVTSSGLFHPQTAAAGLHRIRYTFTTDAGCSASAENTVLVYPQPKVNAGPDKTVLAGGSLTLNAQATGSGLTYDWVPATYLDNPQSPSPKSTPQADVVYTVTVRSAAGCISQDSVAVKVVPALYVPNAFTPNGDGLNDTWQVPYLESLPGARVLVFNRYGQTIYEWAAGGKPWDGTFRGKLQPAGVYVYTVDLKNGAPKLKGTVTLIR